MRAGKRPPDGEISDAELLRLLRAESAEHGRRVRADPRIIIHCHWCMGAAQTRLLDPAWRRAGDRSGRVLLLCGRCALHVRKFMRGRGYEMRLTSNGRAAQIMEEVAAMKKRTPGPSERAGARRRRRKEAGNG